MIIAGIRGYAQEKLISGIWATSGNLFIEWEKVGLLVFKQEI